MGTRIKEPKPCERCEKEFYGFTETARFCSRKCLNEWQRTLSWEDRIGHEAASEIRKVRSERSRGDRNPSCNPETARKISESLKRHIAESGGRNGDKNPFYGRTHTEEFKTKRSADRKGRRFYDAQQYERKLQNTLRGEAHPLWKGGKSFEPYPQGWTKALKVEVKAMYNGVCVLCGVSPQNGLCVHHVDYVKENLDLSNLVPLCRSCHSRTNVRRDDWRDYFQAFVAHGCRSHECKECRTSKP